MCNRRSITLHRLQPIRRVNKFRPGDFFFPPPFARLHNRKCERRVHAVVGIKFAACTRRGQDDVDVSDYVKV